MPRGHARHLLRLAGKYEDHLLVKSGSLRNNLHSFFIILATPRSLPSGFTSVRWASLWNYFP